VGAEALTAAPPGTLDAGGHCVLEMPSGTGKTVSLLSLIVAYQQNYPEPRKLIYCSRTMSEIEKALAELKALMAYRTKELGYVEEFRGLGLTSRKNLCLHPSVKREKRGEVVDARCRSMTAGFVKEKKAKGEDVELCVYHDVSCHRSGAPQHMADMCFLPNRIWICWSHTTSFRRAFTHLMGCSSIARSIRSAHTSLREGW
jgi:Rad3-related DNA helicase